MNNIFKKGFKRLFIGNILEVIFETIIAISTILFVFSNSENNQTTAGIIASLGVIGLLIAAFIVILGILNIRNENDTLHKAFVCFCVAFIVNLTSGFIPEQYQYLTSYITLIADIIIIVSNVLIIKGIVEAEPSCLNISKIILIIYIVFASLGVVTGIVGLFVSSSQQYISIIQSTLHIIGYIALVILFRKASK